MKVSLNELVQMLADRVGQPFSVPLQEELKVILNYKRADWVQKIVDKHPEQRKFYLKDITVELEAVSQAECPIDTDCQVYRTTQKIPVPIRTSLTLFDAVGDVDKSDTYAYASPEQIPWLAKYSRYTANRPKYFYINGYVYIYNEMDLEYVNIRGLWPDQRELNPFKCMVAGKEAPCYTDDDQWDIPDDIINTVIQDVLKNELRAVAPEVGEVTIDDPKTK